MFAHHLAHELGHVNVEAMLAQITSAQLIRWWQFYRDHHGRREDLRAALGAHTTYNMLRGRNAPPRTLESFCIVDRSKPDRVAAFKAMIRRTGRRIDGQE